jgi:hypothetical protein
MKSWNTAAPRDVVERTIKALIANGIDAEVVGSAEEARKRVLALLPVGAEVLTQTSITLDATGLSREINESGRYNSVRKALNGMNRETQSREMRKLGAAPDFVVGSVHAVTEDGALVVASLTGSQQPSYAYAGGTVIWVVGTQKIVRNVDEGLKRISEYLIDKESERARKAYGLPDAFRSSANKILLFSREIQPGRARVILVNEVIGH